MARARSVAIREWSIECVSLPHPGHVDSFTCGSQYVTTMDKCGATGMAKPESSSLVFDREGESRYFVDVLRL